MSNMLEKITSAWTRAWGDGETAAFEELAGENYVRHSKTGDEDLSEVLQQIQESYNAFTDFKIKVLTAIEGDNTIAIHWQSTGKHTGEYMGVPPTGRTVTVQGAAFLEHDGNKILEENTVWDPRELLSSMKIWHLGDFLRDSQKGA